MDVRDEWKNFYATIFAPLVEKYPNLVIRVPEITSVLSAKLKNINATFFSAQVAAHWEVLYYLASLGVSDIYIGEQLCFELNDVSKAARKWKFRVRTYPNVAQYQLAVTDPLKCFFIRPEDVDLYNRRYISTFEFFIPPDIDLNWDSLYRIYAKDKRWAGPLKEIIQGLDSDIHSTFISPRWAEFRMTCGRRCLKGYNCNMCNTLYNFSKDLAKMEVAPALPKNTKIAAKKIMEKLDSYSIESENPPPPPKVPNF